MIKTKKVFSLIIVFIMLIGLCSCKDSDNTTKTTTTSESSTLDYSFDEETQVPTEDSSTEDETSIESSSAAQETQATTLTEASTVHTTADATVNETTKVAELTGTKTITDGNKTIVYPAAMMSDSQKYPVIVWANGTGCPTQSYMDLLKEIANAGYIVVADSSVMTADGSSQIDSINYILNQSSSSSSPFSNKVNASAIGACGHSQGGRSCVNAAQKDSRIRAIVSVAGASSVEEAGGLMTPSLFLTGTSDLVVVSSQWCKPSYDAVSGRAAYASLKGGVHTTCMNSPKKVSPYINAWFDAYLKHDSSAEKIFKNGGRLSNDSDWQDFQNKN